MQKNSSEKYLGYEGRKDVILTCFQQTKDLLAYHSLKAARAQKFTRKNFCVLKRERGGNNQKERKRLCKY